jgi:threonine dehydratase
MRGIKSWIVMPDNAPKVKRTAVEGYGGIVVECASNVKAREDTAARVVSETGATFIHPYDNRYVSGLACGLDRSDLVD